jgi:hypothetical protein
VYHWRYLGVVSLSQAGCSWWCRRKTKNRRGCNNRRSQRASHARPMRPTIGTLLIWNITPNKCS